MKSDIKYIGIDKLQLDNENPRLSEFGISPRTPKKKVLEILWEQMAVNELMYSIISNKFWDYEPLIVVKDKGDYTVVEGNRRLAAVKFIHGANNEKLPNDIISKITSEIKEQTKELPCVIVDSKKDSWKYIGFKHVNGPAKWGSFAKAKYIAEIHNNYGIPIQDIAYQIGDTHRTASKLYQGLMVLEQAEKENIYHYDDIQADRIYFSHLYTGLQREGIRDFLSIKDAVEEDPAPVPNEKKENLGQLLEWLYGSKKNKTKSIIESQNPDLKYLDEVLQNSEALVALKSGEHLSYCYELSRPTISVFEESLLASKRNLIKAKGLITQAYKGQESYMKIIGSIADIADSMYEEMEKEYLKLGRRGNKNRISE